MQDATNRLAVIASPAETFAWTKLIDTAGDLAVNLAAAVAILVVTFWLAGWANRFVRAALGRVHPRRGAPDVTARVARKDRPAPRRRRARRR